MKRLLMNGSVCALVLWLGSGIISSALATECINEHGVVVPGYSGCSHQPQGNGGGMPIPFGVNDRVELADGEYYLLVGKVIVLPKQKLKNSPRVLFEIDFGQHPWLANAKRYNDPVYPLLGNLSVWKKYNGQTVKLACRARGGIVKSGGRHMEYVISLEGVQNPYEMK